MGGRSPDQEAARLSLRILSAEDLRPVLPGVDRPVLLVHGDGDTVCPSSASTYMAEHLPMATLRIMAGCGHAPFMTRPDEFNRILSEYLDGLDHSSRR